LCAFCQHTVEIVCTADIWYNPGMKRTVRIPVLKTALKKMVQEHAARGITDTRILAEKPPSGQLKKTILIPVRFVPLVRDQNGKSNG
jgi:hypothetical protein